jgi:hypothetical protein
VITIPDVIKMSSALLELPKTDQYRKTPEGVRTVRVLETGLLKFPNILHYLKENKNNDVDSVARPTKETSA